MRLCDLFDHFIMDHYRVGWSMCCPVNWLRWSSYLHTKRQENCKDICKVLSFFLIVCGIDLQASSIVICHSSVIFPTISLNGWLCKCLPTFTQIPEIAGSSLIQYPFSLMYCVFHKHRKTSNISHTLVGNKIVDHSDVVGASPVGAAPTTSSFWTWHLASRIRQRKPQDSTRIF